MHTQTTEHTEQDRVAKENARVGKENAGKVAALATRTSSLEKGLNATGDDVNELFEEVDEEVRCVHSCRLVCMCVCDTYGCTRACAVCLLPCADLTWFVLGLYLVCIWFVGKQPGNTHAVALGRLHGRQRVH